MKLFSWPKFDEGCWNYDMIPVHSRAVSILPSGAKRDGKIVSDYLAILAIILPLIWPLLCRSWENRDYPNYMWILLYALPKCWKFLPE